MTTLSTGVLRDRVDVLQRVTKVSGKEIVGVGAGVLARNVPCSISTDIAAPLASLLGLTQNLGHRCVMGMHPKLKAGMVLRVLGSNEEYTVGSVSRYPSEHQFDFQVAAVKFDTSQEDVR